jgi:hypothetical protein
MNPLAVAVQGLGFGAAMAALQGLLLYVVVEVQKYESQSGGGIKTRRRVKGMHPVQYTPVDPIEEDEALLLAGVL